jgi:predicted RNA binding protein YcfA (HicA-like mRNA interferase family)
MLVTALNPIEKGCKHPTKPGLVTIAGNRNCDVPPGTLANILRQAGLRRTP